MTIHYHGGPIWGGEELLKALYRDGGCLISYARPEQIKKISSFSCSIILDNGAFSTWRGGGRDKMSNEDWDKHWEGYYDFVGSWLSRIDWFIIPDVIEGTEEENDRLLEKVPSWLKHKSVPVWHSDESLDRLLRLCNSYERVAFGCCGPHAKIRSVAWAERMDEVFELIYKTHNLKTKIHGLRMLDGRALSKYPFDSADSTNVAINVPKTKARLPSITDKLHRTAIMRASIEKVTPPSVEDWLRSREQKKYNNLEFLY